MTIRIILTKGLGKRAPDYTNAFACPIAKALLRKGILPAVTPGEWAGLLWGIIPVWGKIPSETDMKAYEISNYSLNTSCYSEYKLELYNTFFPCAIPLLLSTCSIYGLWHLFKLLFS